MENISKYSNIPQNELDKIDKKSLQDLEYILCEIEKPHSGLPDILSNNPRLVISPSNMCDKNCLHCISDSKFNGEMMEYDKFESIPIDFLELFSYVDFGRTGDPMLYNYEGKNLSDVISFLTGAGIENYTIAAGLFLNPKSEEPIPKIKETKEEKNLKMDNMLTFSNYYGMDESRLIEVFKRSFDKLSEISDSISIAVIGDNYFDETSLENAFDIFIRNSSRIFSNYDRFKRINENSFNLKNNESEMKVEIKKSNTIYPEGRFEKYLRSRGDYDFYLENFDDGGKPIICPDVGRWPGVIIEHNGDINLCGAFEAVMNKKTVVGNIFDKSYEEIENILMKVHEMERNWIIENLDDIILRKKSTCKLLNSCYKN